jgi:hypothetical protein
MRARLGLIDLLMAYKKAFPEFASRHPLPATTAETLDSEGTSSGLSFKERYELVSALRRKVLRDANFPEFLLESDDSEVLQIPSTLSAFLEKLYRPAPSSSVRSTLPGPLADSPFAQYLQSIHSPDQERNGVYLLSAGARADDRFGDYASTVQEFDWTEFYAAYEGREYLTWFRDQLRAIADVILIDSRTGVTKMGGVCTRHIPDVVVSAPR